MLNGKLWHVLSLILAGVIALTGGTWAARDYVDTKVEMAETAGQRELSKINDKLDEIRDRLGRIEGELKK